MLCIALEVVFVNIEIGMKAVGIQVRQCNPIAIALVNAAVTMDLEDSKNRHCVVVELP